MLARSLFERTRLALFAVVLTIAAPVASPREDGRFHIAVDLSENTLELIENNEMLDRFAVSVGKEDHPTPQGTFGIRRVVWNPSWTPPDEKWARGKTAKEPGHPKNPMKKVKIFFKEPDYYIHGTGEIDLLGEPASHGCIRMAPDDAVQVAKLVMEHGGKPLPDPWYRKIFRSRKSAAFRLASPVPLVVTD